MKKYSLEFKKQAIEKLVNRGGKPVSAIIEELGVPSPTLYQWKSQFAKVSGMSKSSRPQDRSGEEKLNCLVEYTQASEAERGEVLRKHGVHKEHIEEWLHQAQTAWKHNAVGKHVARSEQAADRKKIKDLEKDLHRKNRALAETTALLILKKKADLIWGTGESE